MFKLFHLNKKTNLPDHIKPYLWSYDLNKIDLQKDKKVIIVSTIKYGDLKAWRWLNDYYGKKLISEIWGKEPDTNKRPHLDELVKILLFQ